MEFEDYFTVLQESATDPYPESGPYPHTPRLFQELHKLDATK